MKKRNAPPLPKDIDQLRSRVEHWRRTRLKRCPMPEELWEEAASLVRAHGMYPICRAARLNHTNLRKRVDQAAHSGHDGDGCPGGFVELSAAQLLGTSASTQTVLEFSDREGTRLTLRLPPGDGVDVLGLVASFRRRQS